MIAQGAARQAPELTWDTTPRLAGGRTSQVVGAFLQVGWPNLQAGAVVPLAKKWDLSPIVRLRWIEMGYPVKSDFVAVGGEGLLRVRRELTSGPKNALTLEVAVGGGGFSEQGGQWVTVGNPWFVGALGRTSKAQLVVGVGADFEVFPGYAESREVPFYLVASPGIRLGAEILVARRAVAYVDVTGGLRVGSGRRSTDSPSGNTGFFVGINSVFGFGFERSGNSTAAEKETQQ